MSSVAFDMRHLVRKLVTLGLAGGVAIAAAIPPAQAISVCMPRYISQNIKDAVLAAKAAKYCPNMPYTADQAMSFVDEMRCNAQASQIIDNLLFNNEEQYKAILTKDPNKVACGQAAKIKLGSAAN